MPKDRLAELKARHGEETGEEMEDLMMGSKKNASVFAVKTAETFQKLSQQTMAIQESLQQSHDKISQMKSLHNKILSSPKNDPGLKQMLEKLIQSITKEMSQLGKNLKAVNKAAINDHRNGKLSETEFRMIRTVHTSLTTKFQQVWEDLCKARSDYEARCKQRIQRQMEIAGYTMTEEETEEALVNGTPIFSRDFVECEAAKLALRDLHDRHEELLKLEKGIQEMHDMFLELNLMIESQGEVIDSIETCVIQATDHVTSGTEQLGEAKKKQSTYRRRKIMCISISVTVAVLLAVIITLVTIYT